MQLYELHELHLLIVYVKKIMRKITVNSKVGAQHGELA